MASWGAKLYQNDTSEDVRYFYKDQLHRGKSGQEITKELIEKYQDEINDSDDAPNFWFALADTQWNLGRLEDFVKEKALFHIRDGYDLSVWQTEDPKMAKVRATVLKDLEQKLLTPQPEEKKVSQYKLYRCEWSIGDVFAFQMTSDLAKEKGLLGRYILLQKVAEDTWWPGHIIPVTRIKITKDCKLPSTEEELNEAEYVKLTRKKWLAEVPAGQASVSHEYLNKYIQYCTRIIELYGDKRNCTYQYNMGIITTSKRVIPKGLIYVGNFPNIELIEYQIPDDIGNVPIGRDWTCYWKELEQLIIERYLKFNLEQE